MWYLNDGAFRHGGAWSSPGKPRQSRPETFASPATNAHSLMPRSTAVAFLSFLYLHLLHLAQQQDKRTAIQLYLGQKPETPFLSRGPATSASGDRDHDGPQSISRAESPMPGGRGGNLGV